MIRNVSINDSNEITAIYNHYISNTFVTFEELPVSVNEMESRITSISNFI
jgi:phosphinothricin acetyltransferase